MRTHGLNEETIELTSREVACVCVCVCVCVCERDLVRNDHADSKFSWNQLEVVHKLLPENTGQIFHISRPPLNEYFCLRTEQRRSLLTSPKSRVAR